MRVFAASFLTLSTLAGFTADQSLPSSSASPTVQTVTVTGTVRDMDGGVIPGATVTATRADAEQKTVTNANGKYRLELKPGTYQLNAVIAGFRRTVANDVVV